MSKYLRKYNEHTGKWEIIAPTSSDDISVSNTGFNNKEVPTSTLTDVLNDIGNDISKLKRNVSWLAEHGGGGGGIGVGGGTVTNYKIMVMNAGIVNDTLYVNQSKFSVTFKVTGGSVNDSIEYRVIYDGNYLNNNFTKAKVNTNITINVDDIEMFSLATPHTLMIEAIDADGITIPPYTLSVVESSIKVTCQPSNILTIGSEEGKFDIFVTNKILNAVTNIKITNTSFDNKEYTYSYTSTSTAETVIPIDFYSNLVDKALIAVGNTYALKIEAQTTTSEGTPIDAVPVYTNIMIQGSSKIVINLQSLTTVDEFDADVVNGSEFAAGGNINFGFTPYLIDNLTTYYAVQLESVTGGNKVDIAGYYDLIDTETGEEKQYSDNIAMLTGKLKTISWPIPDNGNFIGEWFVKIKCWSSSGLITNEVIGKCRIINAQTSIFPTQVPIRGNISTVGNTQYAYWDANTSVPSNSKSKTWDSDIFTYLPPGSNEDATTNVETVMNIHNTNGEENGFLTNPMRLRLSSEAYATIDTNISKSWAERDGFTISVTFKSDFHPYNDRTIFFLGNISEEGDKREFYNGMKIDLENVYWYFTSKSNDGVEVMNKMKAPIRQNTLTTVDFVYMHKQKSDGTNEGMAKIFINGKLYSAVEADNYDSSIPNKIYLGCAYLATKDETFNYADSNIMSLRIFSKYLNDMEVVVNSHNARAERDENNNVIAEKYDEWKKRNYFITNEENIPNSSIYKLVGNDYKYSCPGFPGMLSSTPPLPVLWLDGSQSEFTKETYESTNFNSDITKIKFPGFKMYYYDPSANNGKGKQVEADDIAISIQGTSTTTLRSKNLEIYFTKELPGYTDGRTQLFQPRDDWFPESQFTLKADVVDSSHANNATLGRWINTEAARTILEDTPPMIAVKNNPPGDVVKGSDGNDITYSNKQTLPTVKHTLEGFQIILMITFSGEPAPEMLGVYSFNLGRYSYYNMGLSFFKSFSRRTLNELTNDWEDTTAPALIDHYDFYQRTETYEGINLDEIFSYEFGSDADENKAEHNTWSQDDVSILKHIGSFRFNGINGDDSIPVDKVWNTLKRLFYATARMPITSYIYTFDGSKYVNSGEQYVADLNVASEFLVKRLSIKNAIAYYVIANAFGMVDSLGKNLTLRTWDARFESGDDDNLDINKWYPCFYDMDTALGLTNAGDERVQPTVYMDSYTNAEINESEISPNSLIIKRNEQQENGFGAYNSKLWNILRSTAENGDPSPFVSSGKYIGNLYEGTWRILRQEGYPLSSPDNFINLFTEQTKECGELLYNLDYNTKYLTKYLTQNNVEAYGNIEMLHGDRVEYIRQWLKDRFYYLDGIFEVINTVDARLPYYTNGYITCGGPVGGGHPRVVFNTTSPTILTVEIGQNGQKYKYFLPSYTDTEIVMPPLSSDSKRIGVNSTTLLTKIDGLKDIRFQKFESMSLPKFSQIDLSNVTTLTSDNPVDFETTFVTNDNGVNTADIRNINLFNATGTNSFPVTINSYNKLKRIDIRNSCVTSLSLPSAPLSSLLFSNSEIVSLTINNQPYLDNLDFTGCKKLQKVTLYDCNSLTTLSLPSLNILSELSVAECDNITRIDCSNNKELKKIAIEGLPNLTEINLSACTNTELEISIKNCSNLTKINLRDVKTRTTIILPSDVSKVTSLNLRGCTNLTGFKYGDSNSEINTYNGENVLDLRPFVSLAGSGLNVQQCASMKYVKFNNDKSSPIALSNDYFNGCTNLVNVFGNVAINGTGVFNGCGNFFIHELPADEITPMPTENEFLETTDANDGNVTNMTISSTQTSLSNCFRGTKCNLYDVYYILQKCDNVTNLSNVFFECKNVKSTVANSLDTRIFKHCGKVTNMTNLFYGTNVGGILKSPRNDNGTWKDGILSPCYSLTTINATFPNSCYIDDMFFSKTDNGKDLPITGISYFSPQIILDSRSGKTEAGFASSSRLLTNLPKLKTLYSTFNSSRYEFVDTNYVSLDGKAYYYTDLFYNNTALTSVQLSFRSINGKGKIRNIFGGYAGTIKDKSHFPQSLSAVCDSFIFSSGNTELYLGDSFFQKIKNTIVHITGEQPNNNITTSSSSFSGTGLTKYIDKEDSESIVTFPYHIFDGCTKLKEVPALFRGLQRIPGQEYNDIITLPTYEDEYGNVKSMFNDTTSLQNISYLFSEMNGIRYKLTGGAFKKCSLINVAYAFAESDGNNLTTGNKEDKIPYGLFLQEKQVSYKTVVGLTAEDAEELGIIDETYGIKNCAFDNEGKVIVKFDDDGKVISGGTYSDGVIITHEIDEYGRVLDGTNGLGNVEATETKPKPQAKTTHKGNYKTHNATIQKMDGIFQHSSSPNIKPYRCDATSEEMTYNPETGVYGYDDLILDNENYNPIKFFINDDFDPYLMKWDDNVKDYVQNPNYDPRRVLLNKNHDIYRKKWNKWIADGTSLFANEILESNLYKAIQDGINTELPLELPNELKEGYISEETALSGDMNYASERFATRSYLCPPDLFRYCKNDASITRSFYHCGGPDVVRDGYDADDYIEFGLYGVIPPYLFEPVSNTTSLENMFYNFKGILPYKWATSVDSGLMYAPVLFTPLTKLKNIRGMFALNTMYNRCKIDGTQFSKNKELDNISYLFYNTIWGADTSFQQVEDTLFSSNKNITDVSYMFYTSDTYGNGRLPRKMSSGLFTTGNNPKINNCSYFMYNGKNTSGSVPEFWKWSASVMRTTTGCYKNINTEMSNYADIPQSYK